MSTDVKRIPTRTRARRLEFAVFYPVAIAIAAILVGPIVVALLRSFQVGTGVTRPISLDMVTTMRWDNYAELLGGASNILPYLGNSLIVALGAALIAPLAGALAGYVFARGRLRGMGGLFLFFLAIFMVPFQAVVIPLLSVLDRMNLDNSWLGLILVHATYTLPFCIFIMRNTFADVPREIEEAAVMDGANGVQTAFHVLRAVILPGLVSCALFAFLFSWTEFLGALTFLSSQALFTLPVQLLNLQLGTQGIVDYGLLEAGAIVTMIPCLVLYLALQRYYVAGLISGAVKG
jgi:multiple sugar transport system permease protein